MRRRADDLETHIFTHLSVVMRRCAEYPISYTTSAILIIPVTLAPLTGFHASKRQDITRVFATSLEGGVFGLKILLLSVPDC